VSAQLPRRWPSPRLSDDSQEAHLAARDSASPVARRTPNRLSLSSCGADKRGWRHNWPHSGAALVPLVRPLCGLLQAVRNSVAAVSGLVFTAFSALVFSALFAPVFSARRCSQCAVRPRRLQSTVRTAVYSSPASSRPNWRRLAATRGTPKRPARTALAQRGPAAQRPTGTLTRRPTSRRCPQIGP